MHWPLKASGVASLVVFLYPTLFYKNRTEAKKRLVGHTAEVDLSILALGAFLRTAWSGTV